MTDEEMKELQVLEARNLKIFTEPGNKGLADILRLRFLQGKKEGYEKVRLELYHEMSKNMSVLEEEKKKSFEAGKEEGWSKAFKEMKMAEFYSSEGFHAYSYDAYALKNQSEDFKNGYQAHKLSEYGKSHRYRSGLQRDLESGDSKELSRILIQAFNHKNCTKAGRILTLVKLIEKFPESTVIAIRNILNNGWSESKKQLLDLIFDINLPNSIDVLKEAWKQEGFKETEILLESKIENIKQLEEDNKKLSKANHHLCLQKKDSFKKYGPEARVSITENVRCYIDEDCSVGDEEVLDLMADLNEIAMNFLDVSNQHVLIQDAVACLDGLNDEKDDE